MKTERQIKNLYDRASSAAHHRVTESQLAHFAADPLAMTGERGNAANAAGFAAQALAKLENGDYEGFLSSMRLAGQFADLASSAFYKRTPTSGRVPS